MCPVAQIEISIVCHDHIGWYKVAMADLTNVMQAVNAHLKIVTRGWIDCLNGMNHTCELVFLTIEQRCCRLMNRDLQIYKAL
jgi:hypothetical protein